MKKGLILHSISLVAITFFLLIVIATGILLLSSALRRTGVICPENLPISWKVGFSHEILLPQTQPWIPKSPADEFPCPLYTIIIIPIDAIALAIFFLTVSISIHTFEKRHKT